MAGSDKAREVKKELEERHGLGTWVPGPHSWVREACCGPGGSVVQNLPAVQET